MPCDIVYPVRAGDANEELRFSLRCLEANLPHATVWIVGYKPNWVTNVEFIPGNSSQHWHANIYNNILAAATHPDTPDDFLIFNDDFFITAPMVEVPVGYRCLLRDHMNLRGALRGAAWWRDSLRTTMICLQAAGIADPLSYELHIPFHANKALMAETLQRFAAVEPQNPPQWRSLYGNVQQIGGDVIPDGKSYKVGKINVPFHSTDDMIWRHFRARFLTLYPQPSKYEKDM